MIRSQLYLPEEIVWDLKVLAQQLNISVSETIRKAIVRGIPQIRKIKKGKDLDDIVGMIKSDRAPKDLSENLDKYLYGGQ